MINAFIKLNSSEKIKLFKKLKDFKFRKKLQSQSQDFYNFIVATFNNPYIDTPIFISDVSISTLRNQPLGTHINFSVNG